MRIIGKEEDRHAEKFGEVELRRRSMGTRFTIQGAAVGVAVLALLIIASACGDVASFDESGDISCGKSEVRVGETVRCLAPSNLSVDCTLFVGSRPLEFNLDEEAGTIEFIAPSQGVQDVWTQCGADDPIIIQKDLTVSAPAPDDPPDNPPDDPPAPDPVPADPADSGAAEDLPAEEPAVETPDAGREAVADASIPLSAKIEPENLFETRLGLVKIHWEVQGGEPLTDLYIYSAGFYRVPSDFLVKDDLECGTRIDPVHTNRTNGKRRLLVRADGQDYNDGVDELNRLGPMIDSAQKCVDGANCNGFAGRGTTPTCRIDLKDSAGNLKRSGDLYTRVLVKDAVFTLYARTQTGEEKLIMSNPVAVPDAGLSVSFDSLLNEAKIRVSVSATNAVKKMTPPSGCTTTRNSYDDRQMGKIDLEATCPVSANKFKIEVVGIGAGNREYRTYETSIEDPTVEIKDAGNFRCDSFPGNPPNHDDCKGKFDIEVKAWRNFTLKQMPEGTVIPGGSGKTTQGISKIDLIANNGDDQSEEIEGSTEEGKVTFTNVPRTHANYMWKGKVTIGKKSYSSEWLRKKFDAEFKVTAWNAGMRYDYNIDGVDCESWGHVWDVTIYWQGRHIYGVESDCRDLKFYKGEAPEAASYGVTSGQWTTPKYYEKKGGSGGKRYPRCHVTATGYDGKKWTWTLGEQTAKDICEQRSGGTPQGGGPWWE